MFGQYLVVQASLACLDGGRLFVTATSSPNLAEGLDAMIFHNPGDMALGGPEVLGSFPQAQIRIFFNVPQDFGHQCRVLGCVNLL